MSHVFQILPTVVQGVVIGMIYFKVVRRVGYDSVHSYDLRLTSTSLRCCVIGNGVSNLVHGTALMAVPASLYCLINLLEII